MARPAVDVTWRNVVVARAGDVVNESTRSRCCRAKLEINAGNVQSIIRRQLELCAKSARDAYTF